MTHFYFNVRQCCSFCQDAEGTELDDEVSARIHASLVAGDLLRNNEARARSWQLEVCGPDHELCFQVVLVEYDESLQALAPEARAAIHLAAHRIAALSSEMHTAKLNIARLKNASRPSGGALSLATSDGVRL